MDVNAVMKQNFVYRMISETFIEFFIQHSLYFIKHVLLRDIY